MGDRNHEITSKQNLLDDIGNIKEPGWSKKQFQIYSRKDIKAKKIRIKEWDYYLAVGDDFALAFTLSDNGYVGLQSVSLLDFKNNFEHTETILDAFPMGKLKMPNSSSEGSIIYNKKRLKLEFILEKENNMIIRYINCEFKNFYNGKDFKCNLRMEQPDMDTMVIATPFNKKKHFYYNQKINCMRVEGSAIYDNREYKLDKKRNFATLDWGRGVWTYDNTWYWGSGNMDIDGHSFGFNIGYGFGDTSKASENVIFYDGVAHKLDDVSFNIPADSYLKPWTFTSSDKRFEMEFKPILDRAACLDYKIILTDQHQVFGYMSGKATLDDGRVIEVKDMLCFAEKVHNKY